MAHYAKVVNGTVTQVIVAEENFFATFTDDSPGKWIKTSYNTSEGVHKLGGTPLRMNYAGIGFTYDRGRDAFIPPKKFPSWVLDENTCTYIAPVELPSDGLEYDWNEALLKWEEV